jgi:hypothetical protein
MIFRSICRASAGFLLGATAIPAVAAAQTAEAESSLFAREARRICVDTAAEPAGVRALAAAENWTVIDPALVPVKASLVRGGKKKSKDQRFERASAWLVEKEGLSLTIGLFDIPGEPRLKQCEAVAWDLDVEAVDHALRADGRLDASPSMPGLESSLRSYSAPGVRIIYLAGDTGTKVLHTFIVN